MCDEIRHPLHRILLVSNAESQSQSFLRQIAGRIERDEECRLFAGNLKPEKPEKWTDREIIITRDDLSLKDPTISTVGIGGTVLARRADEIICDDILNQENTRTPEQHRKVREFFYKGLLPVLVSGGRLVVAGTVWHPDDCSMNSWLIRRMTTTRNSKPSSMILPAKTSEMHGMRSRDKAHPRRCIRRTKRR